MKSIRSVLLVAATFASSPRPAFAAGPANALAPAGAPLVTQVIQTLPTTAFYLEDVATFGNTIAWRASDPSTGNFRLYYWDGQTTQAISPSNVNADSFSLHGGMMAWTEYVGRSSQLRFWNGTYTGRQPTVVTIATGAIWRISLYGGRIAWEASDGNNYEIKYWDGTTSNGQPNIVSITNNTDVDLAPSLDDSLIAWNDYTTHEARYWDGVSTHVLATGLAAGDSVSASNRGIAWQAQDGYYDSIFYWDGTFVGGSRHIVKVAQGEQGVSFSNPHLHNGTVVYRRTESWRTNGQQSAIFMWDGANTQQLSEWYQIDGFFRPAKSSGGVAYTGRNATTGHHEIRFVSFAMQCR